MLIDSFINSNAWYLESMAASCPLSHHGHDVHNQLQAYFLLPSLVCVVVWACRQCTSSGRRTRRRPPGTDLEDRSPVGYPGCTKWVYLINRHGFPIENKQNNPKKCANMHVQANFSFFFGRSDECMKAAMKRKPPPADKTTASQMTVQSVRSFGSRANLGKHAKKRNSLR